MKEKRIEELEAQLKEAMDKVMILREELRREKEKVSNSCVYDKDLPPPITTIGRKHAGPSLVNEDKKRRSRGPVKPCISVRDCFRRLRQELERPPREDLERPPTPVREEVGPRLTEEPTEEENGEQPVSKNGGNEIVD
ncbi:uncharacterized protein LOC143552626 [Bidens hawaiensis]|uniref:uncharacterized protein LOC143552626 n=1 Tax=Bidens hawaiensis TaxID=980011 RepID=UPI00404A68EC